MSLFRSDWQAVFVFDHEMGSYKAIAGVWVTLVFFCVPHTAPVPGQW